jgi:hypothetical protein
MPDLSVTCGICKTEVTVTEAFIPKVVGKTRSCPVCDAPLSFPAPAETVAAAALPDKPFIPGKPVRLTCPHCAAQFTLSYDTASKMAGSTMKCLKCDSDIPLPSLDAPPPSSSVPTPPSPQTPPTPTRRKCAGCLSPIEGEVAFCPVCGTRLDDHKTAIPTGTGTRLKVLAPEQPPPPTFCIKCKREIDAETVICPFCKTNQASGRHNKPDTRPIGWNRDPVKHTKIGKLAHKIGILFFAIVLLGLLTAGGFWFYKFILSQVPEG